MPADDTIGHMPLTGMVMCSTSILPERRDELAFIVKSMGAKHMLDLTSDVTHLIIGSVDTAKYQYVARERPDVKILLPSFVEAIRDLWKAGEDADIPALEVEHRAPTFYGLKICLTGFDDPVHRQQITRLIKDNGGEHHGDLTKEVTHLVAAVAEGKKYEYALRWQIKTVGEKWLVDCIERGMVLNEALYDPKISQEEQGKGAWNRVALQAAILGKRRRQEQETRAVGSNKRKLRRTTSSKLSDTHDTLWADIAKASTGPLENKDETGFEETGHNMGDAIAVNNDLERELRTENSTATTVVQEPSAASSRDVTIFQGVAVYIQGFGGQKLHVLQQHLASNGAEVILDPEDARAHPHGYGEGYLVVPHDLPADQIPSVPSAVVNFRRVTEMWVESCVHTKMLIDPEDDRFCKPFANLTVRGFEKLVICCTNFKDMDLLHLSRTVQLMGATFDEFLKKDKTSVLICKSDSRSDKLAFALKEGLPAVSEDWLWDSISAGEMRSFDQYAMNPEYVLSQSPTNTRRSQGFITGHTLQSSKKIQQRYRRSTPKNPVTLGGSCLELGAKPLGSPAGRSDNGPLQELSQEQVNAPSPPRTRLEESEELAEENIEPPAIGGFDGTHSDPSPRKSMPEKFEKPDVLKSGIQLLMAAKDANARRRVAVPESSTRRRPRMLGRAASGLSSGDSRAASIDIAVAAPPLRAEEEPQAQSQSQRIWLHEDESQGKRCQPADVPPSQKIIYGDADMHDERERMIRQLGGNITEEPSMKHAIATIGTVKDSSESGTIAGRVRMRKY